MLPADLQQFFIDFQDHVAPKLDIYEQAIYLYVFRHSRLVGEQDAVVGFKSARKRMACGVGSRGMYMSETTCYEKLDSLVEKRYVERLGTEHRGTRVKVILPSEIPGLIPTSTVLAAFDLEHMDFYGVAENRALILEREGHQCFYCLRRLDDRNSVIDHVLSRPQGQNSYRNVVAACRECNNRKGSTAAEDYIRTLYRDGFLSASEFEGRLSHLQRLADGEVRPRLDAQAIL